VVKRGALSHTVHSTIPISCLLIYAAPGQCLTSWFVLVNKYGLDVGRSSVGASSSKIVYGERSDLNESQA